MGFYVCKVIQGNYFLLISHIHIFFSKQSFYRKSIISSLFCVYLLREIAKTRCPHIYSRALILIVTSLPVGVVVIKTNFTCIVRFH